MWVVKLGGSLNSDPLLPEWLELLAWLGGGRAIVVCGGGAFADEVRRAQAHWQFDDLPAHNMAVLAMAQTAFLAHGLNPALRLASSQDEIRQVLHAGHAALWLPYEWVRQQADRDTNWELSSDRIALELARRLNAERLVVVKSCAIDPAATLRDLGVAGVLDRQFADDADGVAFPIEIVHKGDLARMRALLLGEGRGLNA